VVRTYSDVSEYEQVNRQLKLVLGEYRELSHSMLNRSRERMVIALTEMALHRDDETGEHIKRTQSYVQSLAQSLARNGSFVEQLSDKRIDLIVKATPMHDLGKVGIPDQVLLKPGRHTDDEARVMRTHATIGESILLAAAEGANTSDSLFVVAARMAGGHHENWDGSGYPRGQVGQAIPLEGRLMSLADVYDALTTSRVYKKAWTHAEASAYIVGLKGSKFDPAIVDAFEREASGFQAIARDLVHV
jgi:response regulator RpfG family c-di-GMP phosphodiesterase